MKLEPYVENLIRHVDDRGSVYCVLDGIGTSILHTVDGNTIHDNHLKIRRVYLVHNWNKDMIRAWHGHKRGWTGMHVVSGAAKIVAPKISNGSFSLNKEPNPFSATLSEYNPGIVWVPPGYFNGARALSPDTKILCLSSLDFAQVQQDNVRWSYMEREHGHLFETRNR